MAVPLPRVQIRGVAMASTEEKDVGSRENHGNDANLCALNNAN